YFNSADYCIISDLDSYPPFSVGVRPNKVQSPTDMSRELRTVTTAASAKPHLDFTIIIFVKSILQKTMRKRRHQKQGGRS
uniref:Uncharacterized protein n=1 Tax=Sinocyclocheilus grahami TaxID=75366 RepID=A0A672KLX9_SINGR